MAYRLAGVDRFYSPPAVRRQQQELELQQRAALDQVKAEGWKEEACSSKPSPDPSSSNLDRFLESTTPSVRAQYWPKMSVKGYRNGKIKDDCYYYNLSDLWDSYKEWSVYGVEVPVLLNGNETVMQYYVPYLSALQLYSNISKPSTKQWNGEESDSSNSSTSSERSRERDNTRFNEIDSGSVPVPVPVPVFEYVERDRPYSRKPLADKISILAKNFPDLKAYRSCDLLPSSWFSVAWYPIYRIPTGPTLKDIDACFLTFHSFATPKSINCNNRPAKLSLPIFGLASYKLKTNIWTNNEDPDEIQLATTLLEAADNWLRRLHVDHPDFQFFLNHYNASWR